MNSADDLLRQIELKAGDTLATIAHRYLNNSSRFRELADFNNLDIFERLPIGSKIRIPSQEQLEEMVTERARAAIATVTDELDLSSIIRANPTATQDYTLISWIL